MKRLFGFVSHRISVFPIMLALALALAGLPPAAKAQGVIEFEAQTGANVLKFNSPIGTTGTNEWRVNLPTAASSVSVSLINRSGSTTLVYSITLQQVNQFSLSNGVSALTALTCQKNALSSTAGQTVQVTQFASQTLATSGHDVYTCPTPVAGKLDVQIVQVTNNPSIDVLLYVSTSGAVPIEENAGLPTGTNSIGTVGLNAGTNAIGSLTAGTTLVGNVGISSRTGNGATSLSARQTSAAATLQTLTLTGSLTTRVCIYSIALFSSAASTATLSISDGGTIIYDLGTITTAVSAAANQFTFGPGICSGAVNTSMTVNVGAAGAGVTTTVSAIADRQ